MNRSNPVFTVLFSAFIATAMGCASANVQSSRRVSDSEDLPQPPIVLVYNFAVSADEVVEDTFGLGGSSPSKEYAEGREVSIALARAIVAKLGERGINATHATSASVPPMDAFVMKGQFVTIDKGSRLKRMVIGFGAGSSELKVRAQVYQVVDWGMRRIAVGEAESTGSKMPGMAIPVAGGAAAGTLATSAVISGGMNVTKEVRGRGDADAERLAEEIAKRAETFYKERGWL